MFVLNFKILVAIVAEKSLTNNLLEKKKNGQIKGNDKHTLTQYNKSYPMFVPNFKILGAVVLKKPLTQKKFTQTYTQTWFQKSQKNIYSLYFVCRGYNKVKYML